MEKSARDIQSDVASEINFEKTCEKLKLKDQ
jgi:hypothetical protein